MIKQEELFDLRPLRSENTSHHHLHQSFIKLVKESGVHSIASIFKAITTCWESLCGLDNVCPIWSSHTGTTSISNRVFHRSQLQSCSSLIQMFSYYVLLNEFQNILSRDNNQESEILDLFVLLDFMRIRAESSIGTISTNVPMSAISPRISSPTVIDSDCVSTASDGSGFLRLISEDEVKDLRRYCTDVKPSTVKSIECPPTIYVPISREELREALRLSDAENLNRSSSESCIGNICENTMNESINSDLFEKPTKNHLNTKAAGDVAMNSSSDCQFKEEFSLEQTNEELPHGDVSELVVILDQIREALDVSSYVPQHDLGDGIGLSESETSEVVSRLLAESHHVSSSNDTDVLTWIELANSLGDTCISDEPSKLANIKSGPRNSSLSARSRKRRKISSHQNTTQSTDSSSVLLNQHSSSVSQTANQLMYTEWNLTAPCPGVCWDPTHMRWVAHWSDAISHQRIRKYFNPKLLGFERARLLAILTRKNAVDSGRASMMVKIDRAKFNPSVEGISASDISSNCLSITDNPLNCGYVEGAYYSTSEKCWYAHFNLHDTSDVKVEAFPIAKFLEECNGDENLAIAAARAKAIEFRQSAMSAIVNTKSSTPSLKSVDAASTADSQCNPVNPISNVVVMSARGDPPSASVPSPHGLPTTGTIRWVTVPRTQPNVDSTCHPLGS